MWRFIRVWRLPPELRELSGQVEPPEHSVPPRFLLRPRFSIVRVLSRLWSTERWMGVSVNNLAHMNSLSTPTPERVGPNLPASSTLCLQLRVRSLSTGCCILVLSATPTHAAALQFVSTLV